MNTLVYFLLFIIGVFGNPIDLGGYQYKFSGGNLLRSETRFPNGTVSGQYQFIDENDNLTHTVHYLASAETGFKVVSHEVIDNGNVIILNNGFTPEVEAARNNHLAFQASLRAVLPELKEEELPPVYVRHVPSPVKEVPNVPNVQIAAPGNLQVHQNHSPPRKVVVVDAIPPNAQFGGRLFEFGDLPQANTKIQVSELPSTKPFGSKTFKQDEVVEGGKAKEFVNSKQRKEVVQGEKAKEFVAFKQRNEVVQGEKTEEVVLASEIELVDGFTPEVAKATKEHLEQVAAIKKILPKLEEEN